MKRATIGISLTLAARRRLDRRHAVARARRRRPLLFQRHQSLRRAHARAGTHSLSRRGGRLVLPRRLRSRLRFIRLGQRARHQPRRKRSSDPLRQSESFEPSFTGGVGVGYIWGPHFRTDLTVDVHSIMNTEQNGSGSPFRVPDASMRAGQDEVHVDHPAGQRLLRHPHRHAVDAVPRRRCRLRRQSAHAQPHLYRQRWSQSYRQAIAPPTCSSPPRPWSACPTTSPPSSPST